MIWIIPIICLIIGLSIILILLIRKVPQLRVINTDSILKERMNTVKEQIILQKFQRVGGEKLQRVYKNLLLFVGIISRIGRRTVQKLYAIEQYYQKMKRSATEGQHAYDTETIRRLIDAAEVLIAKDEFIPAEKFFIDIISHNPKNIDAYEGLGNLYLRSKQFDQARETLLFTLRLSPNDASVCVSLAELELKSDNPKAALIHLRKAVQKRFKNPKYLDLYIETSLQAGSLKDAQEGIRLLKAVNPENQKIPEFEERFEKQKNTYGAKTNATDKDTADKDASQTE